MFTPVLGLAIDSPERGEHGAADSQSGLNEAHHHHHCHHQSSAGAADGCDRQME